MMYLDFNKLNEEEKAAAFEGVKQHWMRRGFFHGVRAAALRAEAWAAEADALKPGNGSGYRNLGSVIRDIQPPKGI